MPEMDSTHNFETFYIIRFFSEVGNFLEKIEFEKKTPKLSRTMDLLDFPLCL